MSGYKQWYLTREQVRAIDRRAVAEYGMNSLVLMENAGRGVAVLVRRLNPEKKLVTILCGPGNNGGDGFVIARHLENHGWPVRVWLFAPVRDSTANVLEFGISPDLSADAEANFRILARSGREITFVDSSRPALPEATLKQLTGEITLNECWIVDCLFGTGLDRPLDAPFDEIAAMINAGGNPVLAVDIPSGLDGDTGEPLGTTVKAAHTATFVGWKRGFEAESSHPWIGEVHTVDIGVPKRLVDEYRNA